MCISVPRFFTKAAQIVRLWRNEFLRVICDRLNNEEDQIMMAKNMYLQLEKTFPKKASTREPGEEEDDESSEVLDDDPKVIVLL